MVLSGYLPQINLGVQVSIHELILLSGAHRITEFSSHRGEMSDFWMCCLTRSPNFLLRVVIIYRFWNSGAGGAGGAACKQKWVEVPPRSEPGRWFVIDKGFGDLY
ncbi:hypothetical protein TNCV_2482111 [Trichonephila clavipes]|nr:hypothetical protein TNCV_2482111 [Trichonephila clavipes]